MTLTDLLNQAVQAYDTAARAAPHRTAIATGVVTFGVADVTAQLLTTGKVDARRSAYNAALGAPYGEVIKLLVDSAKIPAAMGLDSPLEKAALGPNLWGLAFNALYYVNAIFAERSGYDPLTVATEHWGKLTRNEDGSKPDSLRQAASNVKRRTWDQLNRYELEKAALGSLGAWNAIHLFNYSTVPERYQTPFALGMSFLWTVTLAGWAARRHTGKNLLNTPLSELWGRRPAHW